MGLSKDLPSIVQAAESDSRVHTNALPHRRAPFGTGKPLPIRVPPSWFSTTSTVCSSTTLRPYCRPLPILGFTAFPSVAKRNSPRCTFCPSKPSLRRQLRESERIPLPAGSRHRVGRCQPPRSPRTLPSRPFSSFILARRLPAAPFRSKPGPQGLAPSSGPLLVQLLPAARARCSPGLVRPARARRLRLRQTPACRSKVHASTTTANKPALRQRPLREVGSSV